MSSQHLPDFGGGKVVVFYVTSASGSLEGGVAMGDVEFRLLGERLFAVGHTVAPEGSERRANLEAGVAWDSVHHYVVFPSLEEFTKRVAGGRVTLTSRSGPP